MGVRRNFFGAAGELRERLLENVRVRIKTEITL